MIQERIGKKKIPGECVAIIEEAPFLVAAGDRVSCLIEPNKCGIATGFPTAFCHEGLQPFDCTPEFGIVRPRLVAFRRRLKCLWRDRQRICEARV